MERPVAGDELRNWRLYSGGTSMLYRTINRNKKSIVLDLKTDQGRGIASGFTPAGCCDVRWQRHCRRTAWPSGPALSWSAAHVR